MFCLQSVHVSQTGSCSLVWAAFPNMWCNHQLRWKFLPFSLFFCCLFFTKVPFSTYCIICGVERDHDFTTLQLSFSIVIFDPIKQFFFECQVVLISVDLYIKLHIYSIPFVFIFYFYLFFVNKLICNKKLYLDFQFQTFYVLSVYKQGAQH